MSAFHCIQPHAGVREARGSDPQPSQPDGPSSPHPQPSQSGHQARGPANPDLRPGQPGDRAQETPRSEPRPGPHGDPIRGFFDVFAQSSSPLDLDALAGCFDETFLASDSAGARVVPRPGFLRALAGRAQKFADAGVGPAALRQLTHQELDPHHVLARTTWAAPRMDGSGEITLASSFLLRRDGDQLRIVVYINHEGLPS
jgi:hypothetical protein